MDPAQYKIWVAELPQLDSTQRAELLARFKLLSGSCAKEHTGKSDFDVRLLAALCDAMKKNNVETPSVNSLRKSAAYVGARDKIQDLSDYFESVSKSKLVQDSILKIAINLLYHDLLAWNVPVSSHTVLKQCHRLPSVLSRHFPGYAASGLLTKLVKGL
jgi:hypothetical protein